MEESCALANDLRDAAAGADVRGIVESLCEQPETVDGATDQKSLFVGQEATVGEIGLPLLERIYLFPSLRHSPDLDDLLYKSVRQRDRAIYMCQLGGVVRDELDDVVHGPVFYFGGLAEYEKFLGRVVDAVVSVASCG